WARYDPPPRAWRPGGVPCGLPCADPRTPPGSSPRAPDAGRCKAAPCRPRLRAQDGRRIFYRTGFSETFVSLTQSLPGPGRQEAESLSCPIPERIIPIGLFRCVGGLAAAGGGEVHFFADTRRFTGTSAQVVELRAAHFPTADQL